MTRRKLIAGNWKMNNDASEAIQLVSNIANNLNIANSNTDVWIAPSFVFIDQLIKQFGITGIQFGGQDVSTHEAGAFTGEVSARMLKSIAAAFTLVGHSERRSYFGETDTLIAKKIESALANNLMVIYCCGETMSERESNNHFDIISAQLNTGLFPFLADAHANLVIAYEPVWAIGTGLTASPEQAQEMHAFIRNQILAKFGESIAKKIQILYGGSLKASNAAELLEQPDIDGGLIGGASLVATDFNSIINAAQAQN